MYAGIDPKGQQRPHHQDHNEGPAENNCPGQLPLRAECGNRLCRFSLPELCQRSAKGPPDRGKRAPEREESRHRNRSRTDRPNVGAPDCKGVHFTNGYGPRKNGVGKSLPKELNHRDSDQPRENPAGEDHTCGARTYDVTNAQVLRGHIRGQRCPGIPSGLVYGAGPPDQQGFIQELVNKTKAKTAEYLSSEASTLLTGNQDVGAGGALRVGQRPVFYDV